MPIDFLTAWGVSTAVGFLFQPVMKQFAQDVGKDLLKDVLKDVLKAVPSRILQRLKKEDIDIAAGKALKEFLALVQQDLQDADISDNEVREYNKPLQKFLNDQRVKQILGTPFNDECDVVDIKTLKSIWHELNLLSLPNDFDWSKLGKRYVKKVKAIIQDSSELRAILDSKNLEKIAENTTETAGIIPEFNLIKYQEAIRERYANLKFDSLDTSGYAYNELRLWRMFIPQNVREVHQVLPQVHELPKEHLRRLREKNELEAEEILQEELERHKRDYFEQTVRSVKEIVEDKQKYKCIVILGDPGSGKSTLLQYLALDWVEQTLDQLDKKNHLPIPLLIELRTYMRRREDKECNNFLEFFHKCSGAIAHLNQHQLQEQLKAGNALVMFDGLDEVFDPGRREDVITDIHRFTNDYSNVQVIVASRVIGYKAQRLRDAEFKHFMLQDLEPKQIQDFINRWHSDTFTDKIDGERKKERLQRGIDTSKSIAELAGNPLLLTMMAILNRNQELPRDRAELYNQASRVLLHQWDVERALVEDKRLDPKTIDYKDKQAMLRQVAYHMQTSEKGLAGNLISANDLERILTEYLKTIEVDKAREAARVMREQLRTRNFMLCFLGADYYAFVHRTFLEYFCAWEFVWQFKETQTLEIEELKSEVFGKHWRDETWHEVLRLITGMIEPKFVGEILDYLMAQNGEAEKFSNLFLAAKCLVDVRNRTVIAKTAQQLLNRFKDLTKYDLNYYYDLYEDEEERKLVQEIRTQAVAAVATTWKDDAATLAWLKERATADDDSDVRRAAIQALASNYKDDATTLAILKGRATADNHLDVRRAAVQALASNYKDDPATLAFLKERATADYSGNVRGAAVQALASNYKDDPATLAFLKERATANDNWRVRYAAVQALASNYKDDPATLAILKERATADDAWDVRRAAVQALASNYKDDTATLAILKERATADNNLFVRYAAAEALASNYKDDTATATLAILKERATADDDKYVRGAAVQALASNYKDDTATATLAILKERATADDNSSVRRAAVQALASNYKDDAATLAFLKERATADDDSDVRRAAVQALGKNFTYLPELFDIYYNCAVNDPFEHEKNNGTNPRRVALEIIVKQHPHHPQTLPLLRDRAENDPDEKVREFAQKKLAELEK
ncbi:MAG: HEAT repeat domain-containing protein [Scytonema hyalinum WJT4-NPBG1]|jgi:predicted NACHT family NTPase|nr:HEAT repeat domain-containing protein [Scytonema hyalinum WJT4-NPBG1]